MASKGNNKNAYTVLVEKPLVRPRGKRVNIKMDLRAKTPISLSPDRGQVAGPCKGDNELSGSVRGGKFFDYLKKD